MASFDSAVNLYLLPMNLAAVVPSYLIGLNSTGRKSFFTLKDCSQIWESPREQCSFRCLRTGARCGRDGSTWSPRAGCLPSRRCGSRTAFTVPGVAKLTTMLTRLTAGLGVYGQASRPQPIITPFQFPRPLLLGSDHGGDTGLSDKGGVLQSSISRLNLARARATRLL